LADKVYGVTEINNHIKDLLDGDALLSGVYIRGELSNYKIYPSGHHYFSMKDEEGAIRCVMFRGSAGKLHFRPENGMKVVAFGRVSVFPRDGAYQLYVTSLSPDGVGDLYVAFEQLKEKLQKEGLFDPAHKKPIPAYPEKIAVITSSAGAAVRDILRILKARWPLAKVILLPVRVQGAEAPAEIAGALRYANTWNVADVIITGRGGGSMEDLWGFNDERVARAIYASKIPVISAVGHEPDVTIADFVADLRAATPSNGAELAVPDMEEQRELLAASRIRLSQAMGRELALLRRRVQELASRRVMVSPAGYVEERRLLLDHLTGRLSAGASSVVLRSKNRYIAMASKLDAMSPLKVLSRGYAIAEKADGSVLRSAAEAESGEKLKLMLGDGSVQCTVD